MKGFSLCVAVMLLWAAPARAEHEPYHRYVILGYVKNGGGHPLAGVVVRAVRAKTRLAYREITDEKGFYAIIVHLHDEDLGDVIEMTAQGSSVALKARFDPKDLNTERGTRLDFLGKKTEEHRPWFPATLRQYLAQ